MAKSHHVVTIDENACIGCTKCIQACPFDAIVGANKQLHTVLSEYCVGCDLCIAPCPTQCIIKIPLPISGEDRQAMATQAKARHQQHKLRLEKLAQQKQQADLSSQQNIQNTIDNMLARARGKRQGLWEPHE